MKRQNSVQGPDGFINPWATDPRAAELKHEQPVAYEGEQAGACSFFASWTNILCRLRGSILPKVWLEVLLAGGCGVAALLLHMEYDYDTIQVTGHSISGVSLAFLTVFRSQTAWGLFMEGRNHIGALIANTRDLAIEVVATLAQNAIEEGTGQQRTTGQPSTADAGTVAVRDIDFLALEVVRLLKLHFYCVVEHVRSNEGRFAWSAASAMVQRLATEAERAEFDAEFGAGIPLVRHPYGATPIDASGQQGRPHDPTRAKPLLVLLWLRVAVERMAGHDDGHDGLRPQQLTHVSEVLHGLIACFGGIDKIDKMVLPFPYAQLLKMLMLLFVFSLPFVIVEELGVTTPPVAMVVALAFYGLDSVGAELEGPFGVDENDLPLLLMGARLCNDLDAILRSAHRARMRARTLLPEAEQRASIQAVIDTLDWPLRRAAAGGGAGPPARAVSPSSLAA